MSDDFFEEPIDRREQKLEQQKDHSDRSKKFAKMLGENLASAVIVMLPFILIGYIWTESGVPTFGLNMISDLAVTVVLFVIAEQLMTDKGRDGGKLDDDYVSLRQEFHGLLEWLKDVGTALMNPFCEWQIDVEFENAKKERCRKIGLPYEDYISKYEGKTLNELKKLMPLRSAEQVALINSMRPIELTPERIMNDGFQKNSRGGIRESADEYIERKEHSFKAIAKTALFAALTVAIVLEPTSDPSFARVLYTVVKLAMLGFRMSKGYRTGERAYNTVQVRHLQSKIGYIYSYREYLNKKIYLKQREKYNVDEFLSEEEMQMC